MKQAKNVLIVILVIMALFQTERLWFEEFSNRNFFLSVNVGISASERRSDIVSPYRMVVNFGNNTYRIIYNGLKNHSLKQQADTVIRQALKDGQFLETQTIDWNEILKNRSVLYEYTFSMPIEAFMTGIGQKSGAVSSKVKAFDTIVLVPNINSSEKFKILFLDTESNASYQFVLNKGQAFESFHKEITGLNEGELYYISSRQSGFEYFPGNIFIPQWPGQSYRYPVLRSVNPYGELLLTSVGRKVDVFFNNPAAKWEDTVNGVYTYGDESVVVKYYPNHVLEYSNYETYDKSRPTGLLSDYEAAVSFIAGDRLITNDYYLSGYRQEEDARIFYFDYAINNMPLTLSKETQFQIEMDHPIEITVERENVIKYRKHVYNYEMEEELWERPTKDFINSLNEIIVRNQQEDEDYKEAVTKLELGYLVDVKPGGALGLNDQLFFNWCYEINGRVLNVSAQQR